ncbi:unnamed protein product [Phytophthora fragariaefolia]|uniref:Unnamed protein product n=1 Tax=Phytophthora fragariaefolia TaxID=1490495 RepID=A0A9W6Y366_9STRA|nr:unnamed protein product [Phytophthora fragariaefolia]
MSTSELLEKRAKFCIEFWDKYSSWSHTDIYNTDETAINFDMPPTRAWALKGRKDRAKIVKLTKHTGRMTAEHGWMNLTGWIFFLQNLLKYAFDGPAALILNNFDSLVSEEGQRVVAEEANATVVPLPPNTTAACQPLNVGVMGPLKAKLRAKFRGISGGAAKEKRLRATKSTIAAWEELEEATVIRSIEKAIPSFRAKNRWLECHKRSRYSDCGHAIINSQRSSNVPQSSDLTERLFRLATSSTMSFSSDAKNTHLSDDDIKVLVSWMEIPANFQSVYHGKTSAGGKTKITKAAAFAKMAAHLHADVE